MNNNLPSSELIIRPALFNDLPFIQQIAFETWPVAYGAILETDQMNYMLELIYSTSSLQKQMEKGHHFFIALYEFKPVGFASFSTLNDGIYKLEKIYVLPTIQKSGAGKALIETVETTVKSMGGKKLLLNVNRQNKAKTFYEKKGFYILREEDIDIGEGYFMNDYVMEKEL